MDSHFKIKIPSGKFVIFFDGHCNLCNGMVNFIINHDDQKFFLFESLQSEVGLEVQQYFKLDNIDSIIVLIDEKIALDRSRAALFIAEKLGGWFVIFKIFKILPLSINNFIYNIVARNRYKWFGKKERCTIPTEDTKLRFLETYQNS